MRQTPTYTLVATALCIALGVTLPIAAHVIPGGGFVLLPMHIPVLLCGLAFGYHAGVSCGLLTPFLAHLLTGSPAAAMLPGMTCELAAYGLIAGLMAHHCHRPSGISAIYIQLVTAMLGGRIVYGLVNALVFQAGTYHWEAFISGAFITAFPGIVLQLLLLPPMVVLLKKAGVITN